MPLKFLILILMFNVGCVEKTKLPTQGQKKIIDDKVFDYSLSELNLASNYLAVLSILTVDDKILKRQKTKILNCDPHENKIDSWLMQIKSHTDDQVELTSEPDKKIFDMQLETCQLERKKNNLINCQNFFKSFCESSLYKELKKI